MTKAFCIAFVMTFFSVFDVPVFWPILLCYWIVLFVLTMRRQIGHMIKYKYIPFSFGKQVSSYNTIIPSLLVYTHGQPGNLNKSIFLQKYTGKKGSASSSGFRGDWTSAGSDYDIHDHWFSSLEKMMNLCCLWILFFKYAVCYKTLVQFDSVYTHL